MPDITLSQVLRRSINVPAPVIVPEPAMPIANLVVNSAQSIAFLPGRSTPLTLNVANQGTVSADAVVLRLAVPFGINLDGLPTNRVLEWNLGTIPPSGNATPITLLFTPDSALAVGTEVILDATVSTSSDEAVTSNNLLTITGRLQLPAPTQVTLAPLTRPWLIADDRDRIEVEVAVFDQLGAPLPAVSAIMTASVPNIMFDPVTVLIASNGRGSTFVTAGGAQAGTATLVATFPNGAQGATTINRRASAVSITGSAGPVGFGGSDRFNLFVVNTATLPDGLTVSSDLVDLAISDLPPQIEGDWFTFAQRTVPLGFGDFIDTSFTVTIPDAATIEECATLQALVGTHSFTVTATGQTLGPIGQATGQLTITAEAQSITNILPERTARAGGSTMLFSWRSNTPGSNTVYYRRQNEPAYTPLTLTNDPLTDPRLYRAVLDISADPIGTIYEWYGEVTGQCNSTLIDSPTAPRIFTRVHSTTFIDQSYAFNVADGYNVTTGDDLNTTDETIVPLSIRVRNEDTISHAVLLDVENPYDDLILGFTGSGSVDQLVMLAPEQPLTALLRVFTQDTERDVYELTLVLENDQGDIDRVPLVIRVQRPRVQLDLRVLSVDPRTLVTSVHLTNLGDTLTDLSLDIVQDATGIPANFVIQPDIQHTYLLAGQSLDLTFIPLDVQDGTAPPANLSLPQYDLMSGTYLTTSPSLLSIPGPYRITASARRTVIPNVTLRDGMLNNTCGADGSDRTIAAECTTPAGSETRIANDWYCTNRPNIDVPVSLALPNGGLGMPITSVTVGANFSPGSGVYTHSTTVSLNGTLVGSAIVPSQSRIQGDVAPQALMLGGTAPTQIINLRSTHTNDTHYTVASGFTVMVNYEEHTRTGCFTQAEVDASAGGELMCTVDPSLALPAQSLDLSLDVDRSELTIEQLDDPYTFTVGERIPLLVEVSAAGMENITEPVRIELNVPRELRPEGMTIQAVEQSFLTDLFTTLVELLDQLNPDFAVLVNDILGIDVTDEQATFTYETTGDIVIGQPFPITLDVVGEVAGEFTVSGTASVGAPALLTDNAQTSEPMSSPITTINQPTSTIQLQITELPTCTVTIAADRSVRGYYVEDSRYYMDQQIEPLLDRGGWEDITGDSVVVNLRSPIIDGNLVRGRLDHGNGNFSDEFWFYSGNGNVVTATDGNCDDLVIEAIDSTHAQDDLEQNYSVLLRNETLYPWTEHEIREIYFGVLATAVAFDLQSNSELDTPALFRYIMTSRDTLPYIVVYKGLGISGSAELPVAFTVPNHSGTISFNDSDDDITDGGCKTFPGSGNRQTNSPIPITLACNFALGNGGPTLLDNSFSQYVVVHELGHAFGERSTMTFNDCNPVTPGAEACNLLWLAVEGTARAVCPAFLQDASFILDDAHNINTCVWIGDAPLSNRVMGYSSGWSRGERGWGSGPDTIFTNFQQHPPDFHLFTNDSDFVVVDETSADMFLNWVYRRATDIPPTYLGSVPGNWSGFLNMTWANNGQNTNGDPDYPNDKTYPGDARFAWMNVVMQQIFSEKGW